jgi:hypothetical protein
VFWVRGGFTGVIDRMTALIGLPDTSPPSPKQRGFWGYTATSAADVVKIYNYILDVTPTQYRDFIIGNLHAWTQCAEDGRDQSFGIPRAFASPLLHTTGTIGPGERSIVVVFTTYPKDTTLAAGRGGYHPPVLVVIAPRPRLPHPTCGTAYNCSNERAPSCASLVNEVSPTAGLMNFVRVVARGGVEPPTFPIFQELR